MYQRQHLERLTRSVIEPRREIDEKDLQSQYDWIMTCKAAIERTKAAVPAEATLIAFFDNALPNSYSSIRQLVRRQKHETLLQHYTDYQDMVRGELASRRPTPSAYNATQGGDSCFGFGFWVKRIRTFQRNAAPTLAPPMREPPWRGRYRKAFKYVGEVWTLFHWGIWIYSRLKLVPARLP